MQTTDKQMWIYPHIEMPTIHDIDKWITVEQFKELYPSVKSYEFKPIQRPTYDGIVVGHSDKTKNKISQWPMGYFKYTN